MAQFELGQLVMTRGVAALVEEDAAFAAHVLRCMQRYTRCDWGEMLRGDKEMNDSAIGPDADRVFAAYEHHDLPKVWVITERDRSCTTILFPDEY
jgi:hypothetical protein